MPDDTISQRGVMRALPEPFLGLGNQQGDPMMDGLPRLDNDIRGSIGIARPRMEKIGNPEPAIWSGSCHRDPCSGPVTRVARAIGQCRG
jgi:hypothetical protein